jgi:hypothetical protein
VHLNVREPRLQVPTATFPDGARELLHEVRVRGVGQFRTALAELLQHD